MLAALDAVERDSLAGDLEEEYVEHILPRRGPVRARLWFWKHVVQSLTVGSVKTALIRNGPGARRPLIHPDRGTPRREHMNTLINDIRFGTRMLFKTPGLSLVAILTIALGVGATTHMFSVVYGTVFRGLPFEGGDRLMHLSGTLIEDGLTGRRVTIHDYRDWRDQQTAFVDLAAFYNGTVNLADADAAPERYQGTFVTANLFSEVGTQPLLGRVIREDEEAGNTPPVIVIGYDLWQTRYGADPDIIGKTVRANGRTTTVVGVMPDGFKFPFDNDVWLPLGIDRDRLQRGDGPTFSVIGRLQETATLDQARAQLSGIAAGLAAEFPATNDNVGVFAHPYVEEIMPPQITAILYIMLGAVFGVLLIACANVANLLLARAVIRSKEVAIRSALGASRSRLIRQLLVEAAILAITGGFVGIALGYVATDVFNAAILDIQKPYWIDIRLDTPVLFFALGITMLASLVSGTVPAFKATGADIQQILNDETRGSSSFRMGRFSTGLVIGEIALSCALLVAAGFMIKSVVNLRTLDMGFETAGVFTARIGLFEADYPDDDSKLQFYDRLLRELGALPGVQSASLMSNVPGTGAGQWWFGVEGSTYESDQDYPFAFRKTITPQFFQTYDVNILEGRSFSVRDREGSLPAVIVNESFARKYFPERPALGSRVRLGRSTSENAWMTVVGIVPDLHVGGGVGGLGSSGDAQEQFYTPLAQNVGGFMSMAIKTPGDPLLIASAVREVVSTLDPNLPIYNADSMDGAIETATWAFGLFGSLFMIFGGIALFMAAVGLYGVMAFSVSRRTQEMGIRMALGAHGTQIMRLVLKRGMLQLAVGMTMGLAIGAAMSRPLQVALFDVNPNDLSVYGAIIVTLATAGLLACIIPARRATRVELVDALRPQ